MLALQVDLSHLRQFFCQVLPENFPPRLNLKGGIPMRNLKRALSLGLTAAMISGLMVMGSSAASYADVTSEQNQEAIEVLQAVGIMVGDEKGNFNPDQQVTRNEMAVVMSNLMAYNVATYKNTSPFTDVPSWAEPYVAACWTNGITAGYDADTYGGNDTVTTAQAALMLMKALGYFQYESDFGNDWQLAAVSQGNRIDLFEDVDSGVREAMTRNDVAQLVLNTLEAGTVEAETNGSISVGDITIVNDVKYNFVTSERSYASAIGRVKDTTSSSDASAYVVELGESLYQGELKKTESQDDFGRPANIWEYESKEIGTYADVAAATWTTRVNERDLYSAAGSAAVNEYTWTVYEDGVEIDTFKYEDDNDLMPSRSSSDRWNGTGNGILTEVFVDSQEDQVIVTKINTYLAEVTKVTDATASADRKITLKIYDNTSTLTKTVYCDNFAKGDFVMVVPSANTSDGFNEPTSIVAATVVTDMKVTSYKTDSVTFDGKTYNYSKFRNNDAKAGTSHDDTYNFNSTYDFYLDAQGNVVAAFTHTVGASNDYIYVADTTGSLTTTIDGSTPSVEARVVLVDGTVATYNVAVKKLTDSDVASGGAYASGGKFGTTSSNQINSSNVTFAAGDYVIEGTAICLYDANDSHNGSATVAAAAGELKTNTYGYTVSDKTIKLEGLTAASSSNAVDTVYSASLGNVVKKNVTSYSASSTTVLADQNTKFVVYNAEKKTAVVYTGAANLPSAIDKQNSGNGGTGYAVLKTGSSKQIGTASVIFVATASGLSAEATNNYVYINKDEFSNTWNGEKTIVSYEGIAADGSKVTVTTDSKLGASGLYTYDENKVLNTTALATTSTITPALTATYIYDATLTVNGNLLGVTMTGSAETYYNITDNTQIVYVNDTLSEVNGNGGFVVREVKDGAATNNVAAIFVTVD